MHVSIISGQARLRTFYHLAPARLGLRLAQPMNTPNFNPKLDIDQDRQKFRPGVFSIIEIASI